MTEQNSATPGSNPRMWQGREIRNDMVTQQDDRMLDSITTEPEESAKAKNASLFELGAEALVEFLQPIFDKPKEPQMVNFSELSNFELELLRNQPSYPEMRRQTEEMRRQTEEMLQSRPTPGTLKKSLDSQKRNKAEQERRARQRAFVATTHLTHRPFRAALADFNSKEKS